MKRSCDQGLVWDSLLNKCIVPQQGEIPRITDSLPTSAWSTKAPCPQPSGVSTAVWVSVVTVMGISIIVLLLWLAIYQLEPFQHTVNKTAEQPFNRQAAEDRVVAMLVDEEEREAPTSFLCENRGPLGDQNQEPPSWSGVVVCPASAHMCSGRKVHGVPLPATELGDATLVTTKTVQCSN